MSRFFLTMLAAAVCAQAQQYRAFWADAFHEGYKTPAQVDALVANVVAAKANAIFVETRVRSASFFRQTSEPFTQDAAVPAGYDPLEDLILKAHAQGLEVHAWAVVYPMWSSGLAAPKDGTHLYYSHGPAASGAERWLNVSSAGVETLGLDPGHPGVLPYLVETLLEPVRHYDVDGLHLDYVRYPEDADYGYNPASIERFNRLAGRTGRPVAKEAAWSQHRRDQVTALVRQLYLRLQLLRPKVKLSTAVVTWGNGPLTDAEYRGKDAYGYVFQDWRGWLEEGIVDFTMPMNYFDATKYSTYLVRWSDYQKNRQYGRGMVDGLGVYLNTPAATLNQMDTVLAPSSEGRLPLGVSFYSYASTRSDAAQLPNAEFYRLVGEYFQTAASVPELPWKSAPVKGHVAGRVTAEGAEAARLDGLVATLEPREGAARSRKTDASGFFGWVDVEPGEYRVRVESDGRPLWEGEWAAVEAGRVTEVAVGLSLEALEAAWPRLETEGRSEAAPGEVVRLSGANLTPDYGAAEAVPLPTRLAGSMVVVNGQAAPLFELSAAAVEFQLPFSEAPRFEIRLRRAGVESAPVVLNAAAAVPRIVEIRVDGEWLEITAAGLGQVDPPALAGSGGSSEEPWQRVVLPVSVRFGEGDGAVVVEAASAVLAPWIPGRYVVRVARPEGLDSGTLRLRAGEVESGAAEWSTSIATGRW